MNKNIHKSFGTDIDITYKFIDTCGAYDDLYNYKVNISW